MLFSKERVLKNCELNTDVWNPSGFSHMHGYVLNPDEYAQVVGKLGYDNIF